MLDSTEGERGKYQEENEEGEACLIRSLHFLSFTISFFAEEKCRDALAKRALLFDFSWFSRRRIGIIVLIIDMFAVPDIESINDDSEQMRC